MRYEVDRHTDFITSVKFRLLQRKFPIYECQVKYVSECDEACTHAVIKVGSRDGITLRYDGKYLYV
jgi:hypothetical protein